MSEFQTRRAVVAVLLPREHLPFIREWCKYHIKQGWEIFIYNNSGSTGSMRKTSAFVSGSAQIARVDKRGNQYGSYSSALTDEEVNQEFIKQIRGLGVTVIDWKPTNERGEIIHGQVEAYVDFINKYRFEVDWAAFIDADEYLSISEGLSWDAIFNSLGNNKCFRLMLNGLEYTSRWTKEGEPQDLRDLSCQGPQKGGQKNIVKLENVILADIHWGWRMDTGNTYATAPPYQVCFKHYKSLGREAALEFHDAPNPPCESESIPINANLESLNQGGNCINSKSPPQHQPFSNWSIPRALQIYFGGIGEYFKDVRCIVEFGPGLSTKILAESYPGASIHAFEHDYGWFCKAKDYLSSYNNIILKHVPLRVNDKWYCVDVKSLNEIDLLVIDGPPGYVSPDVRHSAVELAPLLKGSGRVVLTSVDRPSERASVDCWIQKGFQIEHMHQKFVVLRKVQHHDGLDLTHKGC